MHTHTRTKTKAKTKTKTQTASKPKTKTKTNRNTNTEAKTKAEAKAKANTMTNANGESYCYDYSTKHTSNSNPKMLYTRLIRSSLPIYSPGPEGMAPDGSPRPARGQTPLTSSTPQLKSKVEARSHPHLRLSLPRAYRGLHLAQRRPQSGGAHPPAPTSGVLDRLVRATLLVAAGAQQHNRLIKFAQQ